MSRPRALDLRMPTVSDSTRAPDTEGAPPLCDNEFVIARPTYADLLFKVRRAAGLTQRALAQRTDVPQPTIAAIEAGRRDPRVGTLSKLVDGCGWERVMLPRKGLGIDRSQIRKMLDMTPAERVQRLAVEATRRRQVGARRTRR